MMRVTMRTYQLTAAGAEAIAARRAIRSLSRHSDPVFAVEPAASSSTATAPGTPATRGSALPRTGFVPAAPTASGARQIMTPTLLSRERDLYTKNLAISCGAQCVLVTTGRTVRRITALVRNAPTAGCGPTPTACRGLRSGLTAGGHVTSASADAMVSPRATTPSGYGSRRPGWTAAQQSPPPAPPFHP